MAQSDNIFAYEGRHEKVSVVVSLLILSSALCVQPCSCIPVGTSYRVSGI